MNRKAWESPCRSGTTQGYVREKSGGCQVAPTVKERIEGEKRRSPRGHRGGQRQGQGRALPQIVRKKDLRKKGRVSRGKVEV